MADPRKKRLKALKWLMKKHGIDSNEAALVYDKKGSGYKKARWGDIKDDIVKYRVDKENADKKKAEEKRKKDKEAFLRKVHAQAAAKFDKEKALKEARVEAAKKSAARKRKSYSPPKTTKPKPRTKPQPKPGEVIKVKNKYGSTDHYYLNRDGKVVRTRSSSVANTLSKRYAYDASRAIGETSKPNYKGPSNIYSKAVSRTPSKKTYSQTQRQTSSYSYQAQEAPEVDEYGAENKGFSYSFGGKKYFSKDSYRKAVKAKSNARRYESSVSDYYTGPSEQEINDRYNQRVQSTYTNAQNLNGGGYSGYSTNQNSSYYNPPAQPKRSGHLPSSSRQNVVDKHGNVIGTAEFTGQDAYRNSIQYRTGIGGGSGTVKNFKSNTPGSSSYFGDQPGSPNYGKSYNVTYRRRN